MEVAVNLQKFLLNRLFREQRVSKTVGGQTELMDYDSPVTFLKTFLLISFTEILIGLRPMIEYD